MATYYVRFDTYWANSPNYFAGPFPSREAAEEAIKAAENARGSKVVRSYQMANDVRNGIRVHGVVSATEARQYGFGDSYEAFDHIPRNTSELHEELQSQPW